MRSVMRVDVPLNVVRTAYVWPVFGVCCQWQQIAKTPK